MGLLAWTSACIAILILLSQALFTTFSEQLLFINYYISKRTDMSDTAFDSISKHAKTTYFNTTHEVLAPLIKRGHKLTSKLHISASTFTSLRAQTGTATTIGPAEHLVKNLLMDSYKGIGSELSTSDEETINKILDALSDAFIRYEGKYKPHDAKILANFELADQHLQECLWNMLHGRISQNTSWISLLSYISFQKKPYLTSLWLAPPKLLRAAFENPQTVDEIITKRIELYHQIKKNKKNHDPQINTALEAEFKQFCQERLPSWLPTNLVDLRISTTAPPK